MDSGVDLEHVVQKLLAKPPQRSAVVAAQLYG